MRQDNFDYLGKCTQQGMSERRPPKSCYKKGNSLGAVDDSRNTWRALSKAFKRPSFTMSFAAMATVPIWDTNLGHNGGQNAAGAEDWEPRVLGVPCPIQRALRQGIHNEIGVPHAWTRVSGEGLPMWWARTAHDSTWKWRLSRGVTPLMLHLEVLFVCEIPTGRWSFGVRQNLRIRYSGDRSTWTAQSSEAWQKRVAVSPSAP